MTPRAIFRLRFPTACSDCGVHMPAGAMARRLEGIFYCMKCAPVTRIPDGKAAGAVDSTKPSHYGRGVNLTTGVKPPGKRRRLPMATRRARQQRNND